MTKKPITNSDQINITVTDSYINVTTWFLKVLYRCHIDHQHWIEKSGPLGEPIHKAKNQVLETIHQATGLYLDQCNRAGGKEGNSTDGLQGRRFFSEELIDSVEKLTDSKNILLIHLQISTILSVVSSSHKVELVKFKELCDLTSFNLCEKMSQTL